jgi:hypothetical protein
MRKPISLTRRRLLLGTSLIAMLLCITSVVTYIARDRSFDAYANIPQRSTPEDRWAANVKIGIIGDSWVSGQKLDQAVLDAMSSSGIHAEVVSSGHPGAKSRQVYRDLISKESTPFSSRHILMDEDVDYLIVVAGVNDTAGHIGRDFYAHHMLCIIKAAQARGIHPVIVEVPEYGIEDTPAVGFLSYVKRLIYRAIYDGMEHDVILAYREALSQSLTPAMLEDMSIVSFSSLVKDYSEHMELYANPSHLTREGNQKLGYMIAENIINSHNDRLQRTAFRRH